MPSLMSESKHEVSNSKSRSATPDKSHTSRGEPKAPVGNPMLFRMLGPGSFGADPSTKMFLRGRLRKMRLMFG